MDNDVALNPRSVQWNVGLKARAWDREEGFQRHALAPGRVEMNDGKLFFTDEERLTMLALLLENVGVEAVTTLGDPDVWRQAVASLPQRRDG
jgi:hypothetical protein